MLPNVNLILVMMGNKMTYEVHFLVEKTFFVKASDDIQAELEGNYKDNGSTEMDKKRDEIAKAMWKDYRQYLGLLIEEVDSTSS